MSFVWESEARTFLDAHTWAVLATGRRDGSPQQSMVGYAVDDQGRLVVSAKAHTAKGTTPAGCPGSASPSSTDGSTCWSTAPPRP